MACADYLLEQENPAQPITVTPTSHVAFLVRLPEEIVDAITECMRYPIYPRFETTEAFLNEGRTGFSVARFSLSSFSKVCKALRMTVERMLYRDIHVDIIGWTRHGHSSEIQKHPMWPAACLRLLLRTLQKRPDLGRFVRSVALRWVDFPLAEEQLKFLRFCPGLQSLSFSSVPETVLQSLESLNLQLTSFAAVLPASNVPRIMRMYPNLTNLHLHIHGNPSSYPTPDHNISALYFKLVADRHLPSAVYKELHKLHLKLALAVARNARTIYLEGGREAFPLPTSSMQASVQYLRLKSINPFTPIETDEEAYFPLTIMTALSHLHVVRPSRLPIHAFSYLPPNLRSITFSDYTLDSSMSAADSKSLFVQSVVECLNTNSQMVKLAGIKTYGAIPDDPWELGDLTPVRSLCRQERVPFIQIGAYADIEPELMIFFK